MPRVSRWYIKLGVVYLLLGLALLGCSARPGALGLPEWVASLYPVALHLLTVGWLTHLIFGVAHWMFPKKSREEPRGRESLMWLALIGLDGGMGLRALGEPMLVVSPAAFWGWLLLLSGLLQVAAVALFAVNTWPRIRGTRALGTPRPA